MPARREPAMQRYLLDGERVVVAMHQHWARVAAPVAAAVAGLVVALWVDASVPASLQLVGQLTWWAWFVLLARTLWLLLEWRHDWFVATDKRLLLTYGLVTRRVAMMPLIKVTDMSYSRSIPGRLLGYGQFTLESAGQDQALHNITWVPDPDHTYRLICAEMFGVGNRGRVLAAEAPGADTDDNDGGRSGADNGGRYAGWPVEQPGVPSAVVESRSHRAPDTGPIPLNPPGSDD